MEDSRALERAAFGRGKVILVGEHAVVYGTPALAAGIERGATGRAEPADEFSLHIPTWDLELAVDADEDLARAFAALVEAHPDREALKPVRVSVDVALPAGAGLGCSAAVGVAVCRALDATVGRADPDAAIGERTLAWERVFHGNPSGIDNAVSAHGGVVQFRKGQPLEPIAPRSEMHLVIGDSGESASTKAMVAGVARQKERDPKRFQKTLDAVESLVKNARLAIESGDWYGLGQLMNLNHALLNTLMLSTARLEEMCAAARHAGAHGAKLTGSGGGGCMIALADDADAAAEVAEAIRETGHDAFTTRVGGAQ
ncbi:MAG: mevalonate kinase [Sandaracinaceae bacterium]|nr:MAG: mevalonate kinase [Sandaracinaceae bacterium]